MTPWARHLHEITRLPQATGSDGKFRRRKTYPVLMLLANGLHEFAATVFVTFLLIFDPIGLLPLFVGLTHRQRKERRRIATRSIAVAAITLVVVALVGHLVLRLLGIGLPAFRIAGGLLLLLLSIDMVFARHSGIRSTTAAGTEEAEASSDVAIFPLAIPLVAGPRRDDVDHPAHGAGGWRFHPSSDRGCRDVVCARPMLGGVSVCHTSHGTARCDRHQRRRSRFRHRSCGAGCAICH